MFAGRGREDLESRHPNSGIGYHVGIGYQIGGSSF